MIHYNLAGLYNQKNQLDKSASEYREAIRLNPGFVESYYGLGITLEKQAKPQEALAVYETFLDKAPATSSYLPMAKQRIEFLRQSLPANPSEPMSSGG